MNEKKPNVILYTVVCANFVLISLESLCNARKQFSFLFFPRLKKTSEKTDLFSSNFQVKAPAAAGRKGEWMNLINKMPENVEVMKKGESKGKKLPILYATYVQ